MKPSVHFFGDFAVVVMDKKDFDVICDQLADAIYLSSGGVRRVGDVDVLSLKRANIIPMMSRGLRTEVFFTRFNVEQNHMGVIVRGAHRKILNNRNYLNN